MRRSEPRRGATRASRPLNGILLLDKPQGLSSNQALQQARRLLEAEKAGHTGSLDPLATGLLPLCFGEATKIAGLLLGSRKAYETECRLGITTTTDDAQGEVLLTRAPPAFDAAAIEAAIAPLRGRIRQVPPVYSALKRDGEPLYRRARRGEVVEVAAREVEVHRLELLEAGGDHLRLHVECGSGTYVRSLVRDLGEHLGCGAHVTALRRLWVEPFRHPVMIGLDALERLPQSGRDAWLLPLEQGLRGFPAIRVDAPGARRLRHGQALAVPAPGLCIAVDEAGLAVALAEPDGAGGLRPLRVFNQTLVTAGGDLPA